MTGLRGLAKTRIPRRLRRPLVWVVAAAALAGALDVGTIRQATPVQCAPGELRVLVPGVHIWGVDRIVGWSPVRRREPAVRDVIAAHRPDVPLSLVVAANRLSGPMGTVPAARGGVRCLVVSSGKASGAAAKTPAAKAGASTAAQTGATGATVTDVDIARAAAAAGFTGGDLTTAVAVALAESGGRAGARCHNVRRGGRTVCSATRTPDTRSTDRGLWQINDRAHPDVTDRCADTPECAAKAARRLVVGTPQGWSHWVAYQSGSYRSGGRWDRAVAATRAVTA